MPVLVMAPTLGDLLKYELNANYTREVVTLKSGTTYPLGAVLGKIIASGIYRLSPAITVTGDEGPAPGKRIAARTRHILTDTDGRLLAVQVHAGSVQDRDRAKSLLQASRGLWAFVETDLPRFFGPRSA